jgi:hypothetical protein
MKELSEQDRSAAGGTSPRASSEKLSITMWDVSAALSRSTGGPYVDIDERIDEALERGFNAARVEAFPILKYPPSGERWDTLTALPPIPLQLTVPWTAYGGFTVRPHERTEFLLKRMRERGMKVILTTWAPEFFSLFRETPEFQERIGSLPLEDRISALGIAWKKLLADYAAMGLLDAVAYVELRNEANVPFVNGAGILEDDAETRRIYKAMGEAVQEIKNSFPGLRVGCSFTGDWNTVRERVPPSLDVLAFHPWVLQVPEVQQAFRERRIEEYHLPDYEPPDVPDEDAWRYPPFLYEFYGIDKAKMNAWYRAMAERCNGPIRRYLRDTLVSIKERAGEIGALAALSEGYAVPWIYDGAAWDWIKDICGYAVEHAARLDFFAVTTCNFSSPMFSLWDDVAWHRRMNRLLASTASSGDSHVA